MQRFLTVIPLLVVLPLAFAEDRRIDTSELSIMTLNAEFLWDGRGTEEGRVNFAWKGNPSEADDHMHDIAQIIKASDPDMVNLVEVESLAALNHFNSNFLTGENYAASLVNGKDSFTGQDVGLLSRIDPDDFGRTDRKGTSSSTEKSVSKNYFAKFDDINGRKIALIGLHFLSRPSDSSRLHPRQAQADAMRDLAVELASEGYSIVMLGDFNDYDGDTLDHVSSTPITDVLKITREMTPGNETDDLMNVASFVEKNSRYTAHWDQDRQNDVDFPFELTAIDHILVSQDLASNIKDVSIPHDHDPRSVSDHFAVVVNFDFSGGDAPVGVELFSLLPNPSGNEREDEAITVINRSADAVDLNGWVVRDRAGNTWSLDGDLASGATITFKRNRQKMALNNGGDEVELLNGTTVIDEFEYFDSAEDELIFVP